MLTVRHKEAPQRSRGSLFLSITVLIGLLVLCNHLVSYLWAVVPVTREVVLPPKPPADSGHPKTHQTFQLKHLFHHGAGRDYRIHRRLDVTPEYLAKHHAYFQHFNSMAGSEDAASTNLDEVVAQYDWPKHYEGENPWTIELPMKSKRRRTVRLQQRHDHDYIDAYLQYALSVKSKPQLINQIDLQWVDEDVSVPDVEDRDTIVSLATISSNAYVRFPKDDKDKKNLDWVDVGDPWVPDDRNNNIEFGWGGDGLRGHIFVSEDNKTVVIGVKGTSGAGLPGSGPEDTQANDKVNDNLLFSCCCARVSYLWTTVCDCYEKTYTCNQDCLERELVRKDRYYQAVLDLYRNVTEIYPSEDHDIWVTGHSLGGALSSLLGRTYGLPVVAYEAPGEMLATQRLHLPQPPGLPKHQENIWHIGNTADPIYMGVCNGASSLCNLAGYAMETSCHTGRQCVYDVVTDKGWHVNLLNHRIHTVIDEIIMAYNETAPCVDQAPCRDCFNWKYTSRDDYLGDEPELPNPLHPRPDKPVKKPTDPTEPTATSTSAPSASETSKPQKCVKRTWYGWCVEWGDDDRKSEIDV